MQQVSGVGLPMTKLHPPISKIAVTPSVYIEGERTQDAVFGMEKYL
jgi:hypothetical protein